MSTLNYQGATALSGLRVGLKGTMGALRQSFDKNHTGHIVFTGQRTDFTHQIFKR